MAKFTGDPNVIKGNDIVQKYIMLANSHDGSMAVTCGLTPQRIVCSNTLSMADNSKASQLLRIRHTASVEETLDKAREILDVANRQFEATFEQYQWLATRVINHQQLDKLVKVVLKQDKVEEISAKAQNQIDHVKSLFEHGRGNDMPEIKGTAWAAYNAVSEYLTHYASSNDNQRASSLWFGKNKARLQTALSTVTTLVA